MTDGQVWRKVGRRRWKSWRKVNDSKVLRLILVHFNVEPESSSSEGPPLSEIPENGKRKQTTTKGGAKKIWLRFSNNYLLERQTRSTKGRGRGRGRGKGKTTAKRKIEDSSEEDKAVEADKESASDSEKEKTPKKKKKGNHKRKKPQRKPQKKPRRLSVAASRFPSEISVL